jgi:superfamily II RNA helicase
MADELYNTNLFSYDKKISEFVEQKLSESPPEISELKSTILLKKTLSKGIAFHHAGLIPALKDIVEELFCQGLIRVLYSTETFAVGINMPAKTVCFDSLRKFDGITFRYLSSKEFFQISGRAGRRGIDKAGYVYPMITRQDFDYHIIKKMVSRDVEPIKSRFRMSPNTVINLIKNHNDEEINEILCKSFDSFQRYGSKFHKTRNIRSHDAFDKIKRKLIELGDLKDNNITSKGMFTSKIYCEEYLLGEIFFEKFYEELNEYQLTLMMACICYEGRREELDFKKVYPDKKISELKNNIHKNEYIKKDKRFNDLVSMTALIHPCFNAGNIFNAIENTNLPEGDLLRFYRTLIDRFSQVRQATKDFQLAKRIDNCMDAIRRCIELVDVV